MGEGKISAGDYTNMTNVVTAYSANQDTTTTEEQFQSEWERWYGVYKDVPILAALIDAKAMWTVGKGFRAKKKYKKTIQGIKGNGKQTFNTILHNAVKVYTISGDYFAEKIMHKGKLLNLKSLNPGTIKIIADSKGMIKRYEQFVNGKTLHGWKPDQMFHLAWNPIADNIHGNGTCEKLEWNAEAYKESKRDLRILFHRYVKPLLISHVDTDDETEIAAYKLKLDKAVELGENLVLPHDTLKAMERMSIPQYSSLDPMPYIALLERDFIIAEGVPSLIVGSGEKEDTEAMAKMLYLAFQQAIEWNQLFIEEQCEIQLGIKIELEFPASLEQTMQKDQSKSRSLNNMEAGIGEASGGKK